MGPKGQQRSRLASVLQFGGPLIEKQLMFIVCFVYADCILRVCYWLFAFVFFVEVTSVKVHSY